MPRTYAAVALSLGVWLAAARASAQATRVEQIDGEKAAKAEEWPMGERIRAVDQGPDGSVYLLEDGGRLLRLDPR